VGALQSLLDRYLELANSGDAGFWDPEEEPEVIAARAARAALRAHTAQPAAVVRCAECDCEAGGEACNWIKRGPAAGVLEVTLLTEYGSGVEAAYLEGFEDGWDQKQNDVWPFDKAQAMSWEDSQMHAALAAAPRAGVPEGWRLTQALTDVAAERRRQIEVEGWTAEHDDAHSSGQMAGAAICYLVEDIPHWARREAQGCYWPWDQAWWKPGVHRRNLVKAGALILAEIERLDRAAAPQPEEPK
jgi:hypothetical protein